MRALAALFAPVALLGASCIGEAHASPPGVAEALTMAHAAPAASGTFVDSFTVSCTTTATAIQASGAVGYSCQTPASGETAGTVLVAVGDSGIADPAIGTRNSPVYSGDTIRSWDSDARTEYCRSDTGTVVIYCRAFVAAVSAP